MNNEKVQVKKELLELKIKLADKKLKSKKTEVQLARFKIIKKANRDKQNSNQFF